MKPLVGAFVFFLACSAFCHANFVKTVEYRDIRRWNGLWDNPNMYGLLMGAAVVSAMGLGMGYLRFQISTFIQAPAQQQGERRQPPVVLFCSSAVIICGIGLSKSYSRGAWVGTVVGIGYLIFQILNHPSVRSPQSAVLSRWIRWISRYWRVAGVIGISVVVMGFWQFRFTEWRPARRVFSVANINDFSWRNRVAAWEGAVRMMMDRPFVCFGWGAAESIYGEKYSPANLDNGAAIQMNDYFMLGISAGVPALVCFLVYVGLSLRGARRDRGKEIGDRRDACPTLAWLRVTCRAGAIVLLVGFFFDGGLFKLATGSVFWILLELGREDFERRDAEALTAAGTNTERLVGNLAPPEQRPLIAESGGHGSAFANASARLAGAPYQRKGWEVWLRRSAWVLGIAAVSESAVLLATPLFGVTNTTLAVSRHYLVPPSAVADLDLLAANVDWSSRKLRPLLQHASLANYNRQLINWKLDDHVYRDYVLTPTIDPGPDGGLRWRRALWEYFYPPMRKESDPASAAHIVLKFLHLRIVTVPAGPRTIEDMWEQKKADKAGFEALEVAAFRSVGVPARLNADGVGEIFADGKWQMAAGGG